MDDLLDLSFSSTHPPIHPTTPRQAPGGTAFDLLRGSDTASSSRNGTPRVGAVGGVGGVGGVSGPSMVGWNGTSTEGHSSSSSRRGTPLPVLVTPAPAPAPAPGGYGIARPLSANTTTSTAAAASKPPTSTTTDVFSSLLGDFSSSSSSSLPVRPTPTSTTTSTSTSPNPSPFGPPASRSTPRSMAEERAHRARLKEEEEERQRGMFDFGMLGFGAGAGAAAGPGPGPGGPSVVKVQIGVGDGQMTNGNGNGNGTIDRGTNGHGDVKVDDDAEGTIRLDDLGGWRSTVPRPSTSDRSSTTGIDNTNNRATTRNDISTPAALAPPSRSRSRTPSKSEDDRIVASLGFQRGFDEQDGPSRGSVGVKNRDPWDFDGLDEVGEVGVAEWDGRMGQSRDADREGEGDDEDDVLGMLSRPVDHFAAQRERQREAPIRLDSTRPSPTPRRQSIRNGATSPPPHVVGRIVEMGFSPDQARTALATTQGGVDVEAALEMLLAQAAVVDVDADVAAAAAAAAQEEEEERARRRRRRQGPSRETTEPRRSQATTATTASNGSGTATPLSVTELTDHADRLLNTATELGKGFLGKASGLWSQGKERALKAYEERSVAGGRSTAGAVQGDGRPRWMVEGVETGSSEGRGWRDDGQGGRWDDDGVGGATSTARSGRSTPHTTVVTPTTADLSIKDKTDALFSDDAPVYRSAGRRKPPASSGRATPTRTPLPTRPPSPKRSRPHVPVTPAQIAAAARHKEAGNEHFKLGKFAEANAAYSSAIDALPEGQLLRVPLHNNRATSQLKSGHPVEAIADSTVVIDVVGLEYHPGKEEPLPDVVNEVKLGDALVKALNKRASGHEMAEKWDKAREDWERLIAVLAGPVGADLGPERSMKERSLGMEGLARCKKMVDVLNGAQARPPTSARPSKPPTRSTTPANLDSSAAVTRLRQAAEAQDKEDALRLALKDTTDARLQSWSSGKETNLRGLLSSLDSVLGGDAGWAALGIKKLGMADLVTDKQVKIGYMKVIGKLHPDKLNTSTTSLEQRMIANGVFGTLNEAWHAFNG